MHGNILRDTKKKDSAKSRPLNCSRHDETRNSTTIIWSLKRLTLSPCPNRDRPMWSRTAFNAIRMAAPSWLGIPVRWPTRSPWREIFGDVAAVQLAFLTEIIGNPWWILWSIGRSVGVHLPNKLSRVTTCYYNFPLFLLVPWCFFGFWRRHLVTNCILQHLHLHASLIGDDLQGWTTCDPNFLHDDGATKMITLQKG